MDSITSVLITVGLGTWFAYFWQQRSARDSRYFDASKTQFELMRQAARDLAELVGQRLYATHRICRLSPSNLHYDEAREEFRQSVLRWNNSLLQIDLNIRTLFIGSALVDFEKLQGKMAALTNQISRRLDEVQPGSPPAYDLIRESELLRGQFFSFLQAMIDEADSLFRQMHFGVKLEYSKRDIKHYSTFDLISTLFTGPDEESSVVRAPTDFGLPVSVRDARLGIN